MTLRIVIALLVAVLLIIPVAMTISVFAFGLALVFGCPTWLAGAVGLTLGFDVGKTAIDWLVG